jgi:hypothetical protein
VNDYQQIQLAISGLTRKERQLLSFLVKHAHSSNNFEVAVSINDCVFDKRQKSALYMITETAYALFNKVLCFKMHQEQKNTLSFRCVRFVKRIDSETYLIGLSYILATVLSVLKEYLKTDALDQLASIKNPIAKYFFLVHHENLSMSVEEFRRLLQFSETNKDKRNWMHRHVNPAFEELRLKFEGLYNLSYRLDRQKIVGVDITVF